MQLIMFKNSVTVYAVQNLLAGAILAAMASSVSAGGFYSIRNGEL